MYDVLIIGCGSLVLTFSEEELPVAQRDALVEREPAYGRVICRCETVTEGEILEALRSPIPPARWTG